MSEDNILIRKSGFIFASRDKKTTKRKEISAIASPGLMSLNVFSLYPPI
jgi:hypothetical protein